MKNGKSINLIYFPRAINHYKRADNSSCPRLPRPYHTDSRRVRPCLPETAEKKTLTLRTTFPGPSAGSRVKFIHGYNRLCTIAQCCQKIDFKQLKPKSGDSVSVKKQMPQTSTLSKRSMARATWCVHM